MPFGYDCVICRERYSTRSERNEHLEKHFIHKKCTDCNQIVIIIGDMEFELHKPTHCINIIESDVKDSQTIFTIERLNDVPVIDDDLKQDSYEMETDETIKQDTDSEDFPLTITGDTLPKEENDPPETPKSPVKKRGRKKTLKKSDKKLTVESDRKLTVESDKKLTKIQKSRPVKILQCTHDGCTEEFRQQQHLRKHLKITHGVVEKHLCSICNFSFADKSNLKHHMVTHTDNKRFICSFCGARFHKLTNMTEHMNAHLGLKPYKCEICGKDFGRSNHKRQHMRVIKIWNLVNGISIF